jgi:hypothetical protein
MALKEVICEVMQRGLSHIILESDSKIIVNVVSSTCVGSFEFSMFLILNLCYY